jgi:hypothetical protein
VGGHDPLDDREPEPEAVRVDTVGVRAAVEPLEDAAVLLGRDADPRVDHLHDRGRRGRRAADRDPAAGRRVPDRVREQVADHPLQRVGVAQHHDRRGRARALERDALLGGLHPRPGAGLGQDRVEVDRGAVELGLAPAAGVEQVARQPGQVLDRVPAAPEQDRQVLGAALLDQAGGQVEVALGAGQRRAQLVRDDGQHLALLVDQPLGLVRARPIPGRAVGLVAQAQLHRGLVGDPVRDHGLEQELQPVAGRARLLAVVEDGRRVVERLGVQGDDLLGTDALLDEPLAEQRGLVQRRLAARRQVVGQHGPVGGGGVPLDARQGRALR